MENEFSNRISVKNIVLAGMFAAFLAVMSQVSLPMPTGVPITVQVFAVALVGVILGWKRGVLAVLVYILIGAVGVPVFANFKGGLSVLTGLTGGYITQQFISDFIFLYTYSLHTLFNKLLHKNRIAGSIIFKRIAIFTNRKKRHLLTRFTYERNDRTNLSSDHIE